MLPIFFIVGPTAVGKSGLAISVAARCGAEIVGADALQVYEGFDLLSAKPSREERERVPHHLIGTVPPGEPYNVAQFLMEAERCLQAIHARGKPALVVGGTGLYVKALTHGLSPLPEADPALRRRLESLDSPALLERLRELDPVAAEAIDRHNVRRLVRAVEVCLLTGQPFSSFQTKWTAPALGRRITGIFLVRSKEDLQSRIAKRVEVMFERGVVEEVRGSPPLPSSSTASRMIGLGDIRDFLAGRATLATCKERIAVATRQYAKRQMTWFQREQHFERIDLSTCSDEESLAATLSERLHTVVEEDAPQV